MFNFSGPLENLTRELHCIQTVPPKCSPHDQIRAPRSLTYYECMYACVSHLHLESSLLEVLPPLLELAAPLEQSPGSVVLAGLLLNTGCPVHHGGHGADARQRAIVLFAIVLAQARLHDVRIAAGLHKQTTTCRYSRHFERFSALYSLQQLV